MADYQKPSGNLREHVKLRWKPAEECPVVGNYIIRVMPREAFGEEDREDEGKVVALAEDTYKN